jgi:hypothetical protein
MDKTGLSPNTDISSLSDTNIERVDNNKFSCRDVPGDNIVLSQGFFLGQYHFVLTTPSPTWDINVMSIAPLTLFLDVLLLGQHRCFHGFVSTRQHRFVAFFLWAIVIIYLENFSLSGPALKSSHIK